MTFNTPMGIDGNGMHWFFLSGITNDDVTVMEKLEKAYNHPASLLRIISPAIVSVAISPIVLLMHDPIVLFFWGGASRNINDAIGKDFMLC